MKTSLIIKTACIVYLVSFCGCKKMLKEYNPTGLTDDKVYTTPAGFESLVNASYTYLRSWYGKEGGFSMSEMGTDIWTSGSAESYPDLNQYKNLQAINVPVTNSWKQFYAGINLCNTGISKIDEAGLTASIKTTRTAELKFLRAFYYWHIAETWGGVHFTTDQTQGIVTEANKTLISKFYDQIFEDLTFAVANLPTSTGDYGRATKPAAEALLARCYLTRGYVDPSYFTLAIQHAKNVINNYNFSLLPNYADLWKMSNNTNKEVVWALNYSTVLAYNDLQDPTLYPGGDSRGSNNGHLLFTMKYDDQPGMFRDIANGRPFNRYMPTLFLLELFDETKDSRYLGSFEPVFYCNQTNAAQRPVGMNVGDTAIFCTKATISTATQTTKKYRTYDRVKVYNANGSAKDKLHYVSLKKFKDPTRPNINEQQSSHDAWIFRLAEMYFIIAEANVTSNPAEAAQYINVIRTRAALPGQQGAMQITAADITLDFILDEKAREFAGEQIRWFDLKRTGTLISRVKAHNPDAASIQSFHLVRPIPQSQIDAVTNKGEFTQNPGYQ
jgi:hypothetical protein